MPRVMIQPEELDLDTPGRRDYWVVLEHDSMWGANLIPLTVFVGPLLDEKSLPPASATATVQITARPRTNPAANAVPFRLGLRRDEHQDDRDDRHDADRRAERKGEDLADRLTHRRHSDRAEPQ